MLKRVLYDSLNNAKNHHTDYNKRVYTSFIKKKNTSLLRYSMQVYTFLFFYNAEKWKYIYIALNVQFSFYARNKTEK